MFEGYGTCCPSCGKRQAHRHLGWLKIGEVLFTQVNCEHCEIVSLIVRFTTKQPDAIYEVDKAIRKVFEKEG